MPKLEELQEKAEKLRQWLGFWQNVLLAIFVGSATLIYSYSIDAIKLSGVVVLGTILLIFLLFVAKMVIIIWKKQEDITSRIGKEK
jgi:hypothetical protein